MLISGDVILVAVVTVCLGVLLMRRRDWVIRGLLVLLAIGGAAMLAFGALFAQDVRVTEAPVFSWVGATGLASLLGVAVWARLTQQARDHRSQIAQLSEAMKSVVPRPEIDLRMKDLRQETQDRLVRIEAKLDSLSERLR